MRKIAAIIVCVLLAAVAVFFVGSGYTKNGSVYIADYSVSDRGREITVTVGVASSAGYIRKLDIRQQEGGKLYIDAYSAFGGPNGKIGAKSVYTLPLNEETNTIAIYRNANAYEEALRKDDAGIWQRVK